MLSAAKHLGPARQILRCAQDDNRGQQHEGQSREAARPLASRRREKPQPSHPERTTVILSAAKDLPADPPDPSPLSMTV
jgi:hypothetical protein